MAQQQIENNITIAEELYKYNYLLHGECMRIASVCTSLGFSYDRDFNANKITNIEDISDNIIMLVYEVKRRLQNPQLQLTKETLSTMAIHRIEDSAQYYFESQRNNLHTIINIQNEIHIITDNVNNESMEVNVDDSLDNSNEFMNSTFIDSVDETEENRSVIYLYSIRTQQNNDEDWDES